MMNERCVSIETILAEAVEIAAPEDRRSFIARACGDDDAMRREVERLAALHFEATQNFLEPSEQRVRPTVIPTDVAKTGTFIGPYKILEQIGEGGMGVVYVAEQSEPIRRRVALKIIKPGMDSRQVVARFEAERQALALMAHPNIATVLDAGVSEAGLPYFVMELVRGLPITEYCDAAQLTPDERIELFIAVCHAVQHAHQKGIIHRDLKPTNVMVTLHDGKPVPKVIDFGIAKATGQQLSDRTVYTGFMQLLGTPLYMSPEQADLSGLDIDTRSDVYSLGVLLYELLTGRTPFDSESLFSRGLDEMRRIIREQEPLRPSHRISTLNAADVSTVSTRRGLDERRLQQKLTGELDWIVMKALEKERDRRYESVSALASDLKRYLTDEPVLACPPSMGYRLSKLIRKNRVAFLGSAFALLMMMAAIIGLSVTNSVLSEAKQRTDAALDKARQNEQIAEARTRESVAAAAAALASENQAEKERQLAEQHYRRSLELVQSLVASISEWKLSEQPGMERYRLQLLESARDALAALHQSNRTDRQLVELQIQVLAALATDYRSMQRHQEAALTFRTATGFADELASRFGSDVQTYRMLRWSLRYQLMLALQALGQREDAIEEIQLAIQLAEDQLKESEEDQPLRNALCNMLGGLSILEEELGDTAASKAAVNRQGRLLGFELSDDLQLPSPVTEAEVRNLISGSFSPDTVRIFFLNLAPMQRDTEIRAALFDEAMKIGRQQVASESTRDRRFQHAFQLNETAIWLSKTQGGSREQAVKYLQEAMPLLEGLVADFPALTSYRSTLGRANSALLSNLMALKRFDEAAALADTLARDYPEEPWINETLGTYFAERGQDAPQAIKYYDRMIASAGEQATAHQYRLRGRFLAEQMQDHSLALADYDRAFELEPRPDVYWFGLRAVALEALGRREEAIAFLDGITPRSAREFTDRADVYQRLQEPVRELADRNQALELQPDLPYQYKRRALCHFQLGNLEQALADLYNGLERQPTDVSHLTWIDLQLVAASPDTTFRDGLRKLADRLVDLNRQSQPSLLTRAEVCLALGDLQQARADFDAALATSEVGISVSYQAALLALICDDQSRYRDLCRVIIDRSRSSAPLADSALIAWTCSLAADAIDDYTEVVKLAEQAVAATTPAQRRELGVLGAVLLRSGDAERALQVLAEAAKQPATTQTSPAYVVYFEAMALQQLGRVEEAAAKLKEANTLADQDLIQADTPPLWKREFTLRLLRKEAEAMIELTDQPSSD